ncbi:unnamed protein product, partial [Iphiclides podalirius]
MFADRVDNRSTLKIAEVPRNLPSEYVWSGERRRRCDTIHRLRRVPGSDALTQTPAHRQHGVGGVWGDAHKGGFRRGGAPWARRVNGLPFDLQTGGAAGGRLGNTPSNHAGRSGCVGKFVKRWEPGLFVHMYIYIYSCLDEGACVRASSLCAVGERCPCVCASVYRRRVGIRVRVFYEPVGGTGSDGAAAAGRTARPGRASNPLPPRPRAFTADPPGWHNLGGRAGVVGDFVYVLQ